MPAFNYTALTSAGRETKGVIEGDSARQVRQILREKGLTVLSVDAVSEKPPSKISLRISHRQRVSVADLALLTRQLATLISAGLPVEEVLAAVAEQTDKPHVKSVLMGVRSKVLQGHTLAQGMDDFPRAFPDIYRATVASGEQSGRLDLILERLADYTEKQHLTRQKVRQALIYPLLMSTVAISIVGFLLAYVVPRMIHIFRQTKMQLPIMTVILLKISSWLQHYGIYALIVLALLLVGFRHMLKQLPFRRQFHALLLRLPFIGKTIKNVNTARFSRTFGILSAATVPVLDAMQAGSSVVTNVPIQEAIDIAISEVREGSTINIALRKTGYFPAMSIHLIASGEASGQLEAMLARAADNQDRDVSMLIENLLTLFEPALILVMGAIVLFIVLAILLPIFQMNQFTGQ